MSETTVSKALVLYDGQCPLCQRSVRLLRRLDWMGRLDYLDARKPETVPAGTPPLDSARLLEEMHVVTPARRVLHGFAALRWLAWRLPLLWLLAPFLYIPGVPWLGQKLYLWVARNRLHLVPCHGACKLPDT
jgi:predicted DCC family thiol-disulfide oxidoreductase YuxK